MRRLAVLPVMLVSLGGLAAFRPVPAAPGQPGTVERLQRVEPSRVLPPPYQKDERAMREESLRMALRQLLGGLKPEEIVAVRKMLDELRKAKSIPLSRPRQETATVTVRLDPGQVPAPIAMSSRYVTVLAFYDATGAPWPVAYFQPGTDAFKIQQPGKGSHVLTLVPQKPFEESNLAVFLAETSQPLVFPVRVTDERVEMIRHVQVAALGPDARLVPQEAADIPRAGDVLLDFLNGTPPEGAVALDTNVPSLAAWRYRGRLYVRGTATWLSPSPRARVPGPAGMRVYEIDDVPVGLIAADDGTVREVIFEERG